MKQITSLLVADLGLGASYLRIVLFQRSTASLLSYIFYLNNKTQIYIPIQLKGSSNQDPWDWAKYVDLKVVSLQPYDMLRATVPSMVWFRFNCFWSKTKIAHFCLPLAVQKLRPVLLKNGQVRAIFFFFFWPWQNWQSWVVNYEQRVLG